MLGRSGIGVTASRQIEALRKIGVEVVLYAAFVPNGIGTSTISLLGRRVPPRPFGLRRAYAFHDRIVARALRRMGNRVDVVHCWPAGCLTTIAAARSVGLPTLREAPSAYTAVAYAEAAREQQLLGIDLPAGHHHRFDDRELARENQEFAQADFILVPSEYAESTYLANGVPAAKLLRHQYGFDPLAFPPNLGQRTPRSPFTLVFAGRGEPNKGLHYALEAWHRSGAAERGQFLICGEILPQYAHVLGSLLDHPSVRRLGFVKDMGSVFRSADALVLPSVTEGSALVTYEAQASGCVLLVSDAAGAVCAHMETGLIHRARDVRALTGHLRLLTQSPGLLLKLRDATLSNLHLLTWEESGRRILAAYEQALARTARGSGSKI